MDDSVPKIDFTKIDFPTDKVTIKDVRRAYKLSYDVWMEDRIANNGRDNEPTPVTLDTHLHDLMDYERHFAENMFKKALGLHDPNLGYFGYASAIESFSAQYIELGLASGDHQVSELVRGVERQAVAQANQYLGRRP